MYFNGFVDLKIKRTLYYCRWAISWNRGKRSKRLDYTYPVIQPDKYRIWTLSTTYDYSTDDWDEDDDWGF